MSKNNHDGMKKCTKCGEWKPATAEFFHRDKKRTDGLRSMCKECCLEHRLEHYQKNRDCYLEQRREYYQKNKDRAAEYKREYRQKNRDRYLEHEREYYQKNRGRALEYNREYKQSPVGRLVKSISYLRRKTGATIYVRDMTEEQKETLANQYVAMRTLEKTEKELLAASGKKRCPRCDRILDYGCFNKNTTKNDGVCSWCRECVNERRRTNRQNKKNKKTLDKVESIPDNGV